MGYDVTHPSPNSSRLAPSIAAMTANVQSSHGQYLVRVRVQKPRQETTDVGEMSKDLLVAWKTLGKHANFPRNVLVYRDGVSEGQHHMVKDLELPSLIKACEEIYDHAGQERPQITVVISAKRHHTRFGPTTEETADSNGNCLAGTVTDRGITEAGQWDFWLRKFALDSSHLLSLSRCTYIDPQRRTRQFRAQLALLTISSSMTKSFVALALLQATPWRTLWRTLLRAYTTHLGDAREPCLTALQFTMHTSPASVVAFTSALCSTPPHIPIRLP